MTPRRVEHAAMIAQPMVFGVAVILSRFVMFSTTPGSLVRPLAVIVVAAGICLVVAFLATRQWTWASLLSAGFVLFTLRELVLGGVLIAFSVWWFAVRHLRRRASRPAPPGRIPTAVARASGIFAVVYLLAMGVSAGLAAVSRPVVQVPEFRTAGSGGPNIYVILLDGYPQPATLQTTFGIDISPFLGELSTLGFDVAESARTNYNKTWLTLASVLNGAYVTDLLPDQQMPTDEASQVRWLHWLIQRASALDVLRERSYAIKTVAAPFDSAELSSAHEVIRPAIVNEFEARLIAISPWALVLEAPISDLLAENQRHHVSGALTAVVEATAEASSPQFVFAHVHSPHPPFVLGVQDRAGPACFPESCTYWHPTIEGLHVGVNEYEDGLRAQIHALNQMLLATVRDLVERDPNAVVILFSDHGSRYSLADPDEHFRSFLAARTPGVDGLYAEDAHAVNVLRSLFDAYFETETPPLPYRAWYGEWAEYLRLQPYPPQ